MSKDSENILVSGIYSINDDEILLSSNEPVELICGNKKILRKAVVVIRMQPKPRLLFKIPLSENTATEIFLVVEAFCDNKKDKVLNMPLRGVSTEAMFLSIKDGTLTVTTTQEPILIGSDKELKYIIFHIANFDNFIGKQDLTVNLNGKMKRVGRVLLSSDGWRVIVNPVNNINEIIDSLKSRGSFDITHVGKIEREDNSCFTVEEAKSFLNSLTYFFSFCRGLWYPPILPVGYDSLGERVWQEWGIRRTSSWRGSISWFDKHHGEVLSEVFPGFLNYWKNEIWSNPIRTAIYWYVQSNVGLDGIDGSIVLAQAALELLSWVYLVEDKRYLSSDGFNKLKASDQLRLLLSYLDIPLAIPQSLRKLKEISEKVNWIDGPHAFTNVRNDIVHPHKKRYEKQKLPLFEIWNLGLWYIELALLRLFNFTGVYAERLKQERWVGDVQLVPWSKGKNI